MGRTSLRFARAAWLTESQAVCRSIGPVTFSCYLVITVPGRWNKGWRGGLGRCVAVVGLLLSTGCGKPESSGVITAPRLPRASLRAREALRANAAEALSSAAGVARPDKQILFGDLHVHTTFSADAFMMGLPIMQGEGARPVADACDFARYCSVLDFWSINDHAESLTPDRWRQTKNAIRQCNAIAGDPADPDTVAFVGWEWSQVGRSPAEHYGHKNVVFPGLAEDELPRRPIHSASYSYWAMRQGQPRWQSMILPLLDWPNRQRYFDLNRFVADTRAVAECAAGVDTRKLPDDCMEGAATPRELFEKLAQWGFDSLVIPHGTTWGLYTPQASSWDKQLAADQHDPTRQTLFEVYSGHGNSEEYRSWRAAIYGDDGELSCPEPVDGYEACCWRAGEIIRGRCEVGESEACQQRVEKARSDFLAAGLSGRLTVPGAELSDWLDCGSCPDCFNPSMNYRPGGSAQYVMALSRFDDANNPRRFKFGFIASSDNHRARPGTGYKELDRRFNTESAGPRDRQWFERVYPQSREEPTPESRAFDPLKSDLKPYQTTDFERQASFFMTGGLVAVHTEGRSRDDVWAALKSREVYGTSGERILLWFDLLNGPEGLINMGGSVELAVAPRFRVRAVGSYEQLPGCPRLALGSLGSDRLERLCRGECYNPGDRRHAITRIEVVRIRPQAYADEPVESLIDDPWRLFECPGNSLGCAVEFSDPYFMSTGRDALYYVRAIQEPTEAINAGGLRCSRDASGACVSVDPCYGDYRTDGTDDCLTLNEERAWSSPIYLYPRSRGD